MSCCTYECDKCGNIQSNQNECEECGCTELTLLDWDEKGESDD